LPQTGTYTIVADPQDTRTGFATLTLYDVPPDPSLAIAIGGSAVSATTTVPGQNMAAQFQGTAGRKVSLTLTSTGIPSGSVTLQRPDGTTIATGSVGTIGGLPDAVSLPVDGIYTIVVDPSGAATGTATLQLYDVPIDVTGTA